VHQLGFIYKTKCSELVGICKQSSGVWCTWSSYSAGWKFWLQQYGTGTANTYTEYTGMAPFL